MVWDAIKINQTKMRGADVLAIRNTKKGISKEITITNWDSSVQNNTLGKSEVHISL